MFKFIVLTFISYIAIDFAVYYLGKKDNVSFMDIALHHSKMLPIYLIANVLLTIGFIYGSGKGYNAMMLFSLSMGIWVVSLIIVSMVLYKVYPNWLSVIGFLFVLCGIFIVNYSLKK